MPDSGNAGLEAFALEPLLVLHRGKNVRATQLVVANGQAETKTGVAE